MKKNVVGCIPIGPENGMNLPYPKEMLPHPLRDNYLPIIALTVEQLKLGGCSKVAIIHNGKEHNSIRDFYSDDDRVIHVVVERQVPLTMILPSAFLELQGRYHFDDYILAFGDGYYSHNPFPKLIFNENTAVAISTVPDDQKLDRFYPNRTDKFRHQVYRAEDESCSDKAWCALKMSSKCLQLAIQKKHLELADSLACYLNSKVIDVVDIGYYYDIGTWANYHEYAKSIARTSNTETERKYDASDIERDCFVSLFESEEDAKHIEITSTDYYFSSELNPEIEFVRYRAKGDSPHSKSDFTVKTRPNGTSTRFELTIPLDDRITEHDALLFLSAIGLQPTHEIIKTCDIIYMKDSDYVFYKAADHKNTFKFIEVETKSEQPLNTLSQAELFLEQLPGFTSGAIINKSKFQIFSEGTA